jgi:putative hemolysin
LEDSECYFWLLNITDIVLHPFSLGIAFGLLGLVLLLVGSATISGSEIAFFSLSPQDLNKLEKKGSNSSRTVLAMLNNQEKLLATIVVTNNFVNIAIVILATIITDLLIDFSDAAALGFVFKVIVITFLLLLFGEILPKLYANSQPMRFSLVMARPLLLLQGIVSPVSMILIKSGAFIYRRVSRKKENISINDLSHALDLTSTSLKEDKRILKGIIDFGNKAVTEIMKPRIDVVTVRPLYRS